METVLQASKTRADSKSGATGVLVSMDLATSHNTALPWRCSLALCSNREGEGWTEGLGQAHGPSCDPSTEVVHSS